jgi:hypothetical protein
MAIGGGSWPPLRTADEWRRHNPFTLTGLGSGLRFISSSMAKATRPGMRPSPLLIALHPAQAQALL